MDRKTIQAYNKLAVQYDLETKGFWETFPKTFLNEFAKAARGKVLDIGSGPGRDAVLLSGLGLEVVCLDASEEMVKQTELQGFASVKADFKNLPFESKAFNGAWAYTSLLHVPKSEIGLTLKEIKRVLQNNGVLAVGLIEGDNEGYYESSGMKIPRWFSFYAEPEIRSILNSQGFEIVYSEKFKPKSKVYLNFIAKNL